VLKSEENKGILRQSMGQYGFFGEKIEFLLKILKFMEK
jgi:hypothetical protein